MIGQLRGLLQIKRPPYLLVDVQGVGYEVEAPMTTIYKLPDVGGEVVLFTHLVVRDDAHLLFGFANEVDRRLFRTLIKVNGVGARMALTILSGMEADTLARCISAGDIQQLVRLPGIGRKTAERLVVEMADRLAGWTTAPATGAGATGMHAHANAVEEAISALIALGYRPQEASRYVHAVQAEGLDSEALIREALKASIR